MNQQTVHSNQVPPPNYLVWAILTTILCCLPFGVISIVYAAQVNSKWVAGDFEGALNSSKNAKLWAWVSFAVSLAGAILWISLIAIGIIAGIGMEAFNLA